MDANQRAQQLEERMQAMMKQSEADKEKIERLTNALREQELKGEQDRQQAQKDDELRRNQEQMRRASEREREALEAQIQQLKQEREVSEKLYEKQQLEEKQRNEKLVADLQKKNAETESKVKQAEEARSAGGGVVSGGRQGETWSEGTRAGGSEDEGEQVSEPAGSSCIRSNQNLAAEKNSRKDKKSRRKKK